MRHNKAAKVAARERARTTGKYTSARREVVQQHATFDADICVPHSEIAGIVTDLSGRNEGADAINIGRYGGHGVVVSAGESNAGGLSIALMRTLADKYSPQRLNLMTWGFDDVQLRTARLGDHLVNAESDSLSSWLAAALLEMDIRLTRLERAQVPSVTDYRSAVSASEAAKIPDIVIVVRLELGTGATPSREELRPLSKLLHCGRSLGMFVVIDPVTGDLSADATATTLDALDADKVPMRHLCGWTLQSPNGPR
ncbi:MAG: hypothetical protein WBD41_09775 [Rhodococcus sp. (in: high G+C Gram-positive bacteria)]|jgi:hypothetical protein|uniref:hypothetical protein n=1 Tax=Rhodococcus sp. KRD162 TaxID=2729725 RepID=UPI0019D05DCC|nr:hypothetical protein [Rhodococcus sp. KRD162]